jgi:hypothetical protein
MRHLLHVTVLTSLAATAGVVSAVRATAGDRPQRLTFSVRVAGGTAPSGAGAILTLWPPARRPPSTPRGNALLPGDEPSMPGDFSLRLVPPRQIVPRGATARYTLRLTRAAGFREQVTLRVLRLPRGATASWTPTALTVATDPDQRLGSDRLVVEGASRAGEGPVRRTASVVLTVVERRSSIDGDISAQLYPGGGVPLDLLLTNPHGVDIRVTALTVNVDATTTNPNCSGDANYGVTQYSGSYPLVLPPGSTRLSALVEDSSNWPQVWMHDLPTNQDACRGAVLSLSYSGVAS